MKSERAAPPVPDSPSPAPAAAARAETVDLVALRVLPTAVRCRDPDGRAVTWRRSVAGIVPGCCLSIDVERRWTFRRTDMIGGRLRHASLSLRALSRAGFDLPRSTADGLRCPGENDERLREGLAELSTGEWLAARGLLLDVLEQEPGCLVAHAALGDLMAELHHRREALAHHAAAVRLGLGALSREGCLPLDPSGAVERALLAAVIGRARLHAVEGRPDSAVSDLRRALAWDPTDVLGAGALLREIETLGGRPADDGDPPPGS